ncbi:MULTISPECIES: recombinase family protein [Enterobacterales]|uniref:recombinase family protein n=1 Tax=Enterobacterales TaxID=91347 RepID=UPI000907DC7A
MGRLLLIHYAGRLAQQLVCNAARPAFCWQLQRQRQFPTTECFIAQQRQKGVRVFLREASDKLVFGIFAAQAEFERELIAERTTAGQASEGTRGKKGRPKK